MFLLELGRMSGNCAANALRMSMRSAGSGGPRWRSCGGGCRRRRRRVRLPRGAPSRSDSVESHADVSDRFVLHNRFSCPLRSCHSRGVRHVRPSRAVLAPDAVLFSFGVSCSGHAASQVIFLWRCPTPRMHVGLLRVHRSGGSWARCGELMRFLRGWFQLMA